MDGPAHNRSCERSVWRRNVDQIVDAVADGVLIVDEKCRIRHANAAAERIFGMPREELIGRRCDDPAWSLTTHDGTPIAKNELVCHRALKSGEVLRSAEQCIRRPDGTQVMLLVGASPLRDESGHIGGVINTYTDITNLKRAEEVLRESEERYRNVYNTAPLAFVLWDRETRVTGWNDQAEEVFGWSREEILGKNFFDYIIPESARVRVEEIVKLLLEGKLPSYSVNENVTKGGRIILCEWNNSIVRDSDGSITGAISLGLDITEAKLAEEELKKKDRAIRRAYVDVIAAVTGNRLILMTPDEIDAALGELVTKPSRISSYRSLSRARAEISTAIAFHFPDARGIQEFIVGVCEGLTNAVKHGGSGQYEVRSRNGTAQVVIRDKGSGVDFTTVPKATLEAGFSTQGTLGVGFTIMLEMSHRVLLSTEAGGTVLVLELSSR